jgi:hypothetical protein
MKNMADNALSKAEVFFLALTCASCLCLSDLLISEHCAIEHDTYQRTLQIYDILYDNTVLFSTEEIRPLAVFRTCTMYSPIH